MKTMCYWDALKNHPFLGTSGAAQRPAIAHVGSHRPLHVLLNAWLK